MKNNFLHQSRFIPFSSLAWIALIVLLMSANMNVNARSTTDAQFEKYVAETLPAMWREFPEQGVRLGYYKYADKLRVPNAATRQSSLAFYDRQLKALSAFDASRLSAANRINLTLMKNQFQSSRWDITEFKSWQWQPSQYNVGYDFGLLLNTEYAPLATRLRQVLTRMAVVPAYYAAAKESIATPTLEHTSLALLQNQGTLGVFDDRLIARVEASTLTKAEKALFKKRADAARNAVGDFVNYLTALEAKLTADSSLARNFRIGRALYEQKFAFDIQSGLTVDALHKRAIAEKASLHAAMAERARLIWPKYMGNAEIPADSLDMIRLVLNEMSKRHTKPDEFVETIRKQIPALEAFVREKDLVDQDPTRPLVVRETPLYMRGFAGASIRAPGPYDPKANTYYNVTPLDTMSAEDSESYLREYNDWMLQILNIHEAIPGHYTQLMHANKSKSMVKSIFRNGSMIEGWAVFGEKLMLDAGYDNNSPEIWLMWMKWNLRSVVNTILDNEIQTMNMSRDAAITMMTREAFRQQKEATNKWRRATLSQVQLTSYYNGYAEITDLRDMVKQKQGDKFSVKQFNNQFLSYGNAPVRSIRELMLASME
jgi:uncharacterized protein (DUF885 family)